MLNRRSFIAAAGMAMAVPALARPFGSHRGGATGFSPDGSVIMYPPGNILNSAYGVWSIGDLFAGGNVFRPVLNGRYVAQIQNLPGIGLDFSAGSASGVYQLWIDHGGFIYAFVNGDNGYWMYDNGGWLASGDTTARFAPAAGYALPSPIYSPPYTNSPDGTNVPTVSTVTNQDGVWSLNSGTLTLNGIPVLQNRSGNNNSYPPNSYGASSITINSHGTIFAQLTADSSWRCFAGLAANPSTGPTSSVVPVSMTVLPAGGNLNCQVSHSAPLNTPVASVTATLSDGSTIVPTNPQLTFAFPGTSSFLAYSSPNIVTNTTGQSAGSFADAIVIVTLNGTSFCLGVNVAFT